MHFDNKNEERNNCGVCFHDIVKELKEKSQWWYSHVKSKPYRICKKWIQLYADSLLDSNPLKRCGFTLQKITVCEETDHVMLCSINKYWQEIQFYLSKYSIQIL